MNYKILSACITLAFCCETSATNIQQSSLAEQCRQMLKTVDKTTNKYVYYGGITGQTLNKTKATTDIQRLYQNALDEKINAAREAVTESRLMGSVEEDTVRREFCKKEIDELDRIHKQTTQLKEWIISSTSNDCLTILKETVCKGL